MIQDKHMYGGEVRKKRHGENTQKIPESDAVLLIETKRRHQKRYNGWRVQATQLSRSSSRGTGPSYLSR